MTGLFILGSIAVAVSLGYILGYEVGVKETEKRWSETVQKADWIMRYGNGQVDGRRYS